MTTISDYDNAPCPFADVPSRLLTRFGGGAGTIALRMTLGDLRVERDVEITLTAKPAYPGYALFDVAWAPKDGGPYPTFHGTLSVADEGPGWSRLEIDGTYAPPFGPIGAVFDAAVGRRIAQATLRELLAELRRTLTPAQTTP